MIFGVNEIAPILLKILDLTETDIPRFRSIFISEDKILVYTRTGGGNREFYDSEESCRDNYPSCFEGDPSEFPTKPWNDDLRKHPCYLCDEDDDYDCTYANFYFKFPEQYAEDLKNLNMPEYKPSAEWEKFLNKFKEEK